MFLNFDLSNLSRYCTVLFVILPKQSHVHGKVECRKKKGELSNLGNKLQNYLSFSLIGSLIFLTKEILLHSMRYFFFPFFQYTYAGIDFGNS